MIRYDLTYKMGSKVEMVVEENQVGAYVMYGDVVPLLILLNELQDLVEDVGDMDQEGIYTTLRDIVRECEDKLG